MFIPPCQRGLLALVHDPLGLPISGTIDLSQPMAIANPTAELLRSAAGVGYLPLGPGVTPSPVDSEWLAQVAWGYSGVEPFFVPPVVRLPFVYRSPRRMRARKRVI